MRPLKCSNTFTGIGQIMTCI